MLAIIIVDFIKTFLNTFSTVISQFTPSERLHFLSTTAAVNAATWDLYRLLNKQKTSPRLPTPSNMTATNHNGPKIPNW